jgi:uncharacterized protein
MAAAAMPLNELKPRLQARAEQHPLATSLPMLDGYVAAIVAGPVSMSHSTGSVRFSPSTPTHSTMAARRSSPRFSAVALRHNDISNVLSTAPRRFAPVQWLQAE